SIESSDGLMYQGVAVVDQKSGSLIRSYEWFPHFNVVHLIPSEMLITESVSFAGKEHLSGQYDEILELLDRACKQRNEAVFAVAATKSAQLNQHYVRNPTFEK